MHSVWKKPDAEEKGTLENSLVQKLHTGAKSNFFPEITKYSMFEKCEFREKGDFKNVNFVKTETLKMWTLSKMRLWKYEFCEKWDFEIANFVKNEILELWILWIIIALKREFLDE